MSGMKVAGGAYPAQLVKACGLLRVTPGELLDWAVTRRSVKVVTGEGKKYVLAVEGSWRPHQAAPDGGAEAPLPRPAKVAAAEPGDKPGDKPKKPKRGRS